MSENDSAMRYEAEMPDTFDLVERAEYVVNAVTGVVEPEHDYAPCHYVGLCPPSRRHHSADWMDMPDYVENLAMMRVVTGRELRSDVERAMIASMLSTRGEDGLFYQLPVREDTPWRAGGRTRGKFATDDDLAQVCGPWLATLTTLYQTTGDPAWADRAKAYAATIARIALYEDDYAYIPVTDEVGLEFSYQKRGGWCSTREPRSEQDGNEGTVMAYYGGLLKGLAVWGSVGGDERALEIAGKLMRFMLKPKMWLGRIQSWEDSKWVGHRSPYRMPAAHFRGHFAGILMGLRGIADYAVAVGDRPLIEFARQGYEYARNFGFASLGWWGENQCTREMIAMAIKLSEAGVGDYWDDAERYTVNELAESQVIDTDTIKRLCVESGQPLTEEQEEHLGRIVGGVGSGEWVNMSERVPDPTASSVGYCGIYAQGFYHVFESAVRHAHGMVRVNLPFNRVSPWLDVHSYLPYEGKLVVVNKTAHSVAVRVPGWVAKRSVNCTVNNNLVTLFWCGQYLSFSGLAPGDEIRISFPMVEWTENCTWRGFEEPVPLHEEMNWVPRYVLRFKGNTCVGIDFNYHRTIPSAGASSEGGKRERIVYPAYKRDHFMNDVAPMKRVNCYVPTTTVTW